MRGYRTFNPAPHPGELKLRISIGRSVDTVNENGYPARTDEIIATVWASADDAGNEVYTSADTETLDDVINFTIRYRTDVKVGMWVEMEGERREIINIGHYSYAKRYLGLKTRAKKVSG